MKKTLLALAALAATSASFAQSTVTLYGVVDASVESVNVANGANKGTVTRVSSGNLATSRIGFKGTEDLGGGLKAKFTLESGIAVDTGAANTTRFFDRNAWVALGGGFGEVRVGRTDSFVGELGGNSNIFGGQAYDALKIIGSRNQNDYRRLDNSVSYYAPAFVPGLELGAQYSTAAVGTSSTTTGSEVAGSNFGKSYGLTAKYTVGPLAAGVAYLSVKDANTATAGDQKANDTLGFVSYDLGAAKVTGYYNAETNLANTAGLRRQTLLGAKVAVPVSPEFTVIADASIARNVKGNLAGDDNAEILAVKGIYTLSKRTAVYGLFTNVNNGAATGLGVAAVPASKTSHGIAVGVRHMF